MKATAPAIEQRPQSAEVLAWRILGALRLVRVEVAERRRHVDAAPEEHGRPLAQRREQAVQLLVRLHDTFLAPSAAPGLDDMTYGTGRKRHVLGHMRARETPT